MNIARVPPLLGTKCSYKMNFIVLEALTGRFTSYMGCMVKGDGTMSWPVWILIATEMIFLGLNHPPIFELHFLEQIYLNMIWSSTTKLYRKALSRPIYLKAKMFSKRLDPQGSRARSQTWVYVSWIAKHAFTCFMYTHWLMHTISP